MRRSHAVSLTILATISTTLLLYGCDEQNSNEDIKHCVDENDNVVDEAQCGTIDSDAGIADMTDPDTGVVHHGSHGSGGIYFIPYRWYYGGGGVVRSPGTRVSGGTYSPSVGRSYSAPSTVISRGGFGSTGRSSGFSGGSGS